MGSSFKMLKLVFFLKFTGLFKRFFSTQCLKKEKSHGHKLMKFLCEYSMPRLS